MLARQLSTESSPAGYREIVTRPEAPPGDVIRPLPIGNDIRPARPVVLAAARPQFMRGVSFGPAAMRGSTLATAVLEEPGRASPSV